MQSADDRMIRRFKRAWLILSVGCSIGLIIVFGFMAWKQGQLQDEVEFLESELAECSRQHGMLLNFTDDQRDDCLDNWQMCEDELESECVSCSMLERKKADDV